MRYSTAVAVGALAVLPLARATTSILTFLDSNCAKIQRLMDTPDTQGSGPCNQLISPYSSFMIRDIGEDCGVTIYGNVPFCSSPVLELAQVNTCYNTTWAWFSVDNCLSTQPNPSTSSEVPIATSLSSTSSETPSATSSPSTTSPPATSSVSSPTASPTTSSTTAPTVFVPVPDASSSKSSSTNAGAIAGGVVGGIAIIAAVVVYFFAIRPAQQKRKFAAPPPPAVELPDTESSTPIKKDHPYHELTDPPVYEMSPQYIAEVHGEHIHRHELA
ncbi:hypothetical protein F4861DRAFT_209592 [Xylaria intraflava]|nr:hypothetical protein F4861DRAFT_209592 [Xylaria intraflava]